MFNFSNSETALEICTARYVIEINQGSGLETATSVGADIFNCKIWDLDQLMGRPDRLGEIITHHFVMALC